jgi:peptide/nickel transport system permease protein
VIGERVANTFWLSLMTLVLTYAIAIPLGVAAGRFKGTIVDKSIMFFIFVALAMPTLVLGILMILFFSFHLGWFPSGGSVNAIVLAGGDAWEIFLNRVHHMILPATTGAILGTVGIVFMLRANIIERTYSEYVTLARSKGVPTSVIFRRHILRNSLIPVAAGFGFAISGLLTGQLFIEQIFHYPGMGLLFFQSIRAQDFAVVNAIIIIFSALAALGMLISDILLTIADPRIRIE